MLTKHSIIIARHHLRKLRDWKNEKNCFLALIVFLYYAFVQQPIVTLTELSISCVISVLPKLYSLELVNRSVTKAALIEVTHFREYLIAEVERFEPENRFWKHIQLPIIRFYKVALHEYCSRLFAKKYLISMAMCEKNSWSTILPIKRKRILLTFCGNQNS